MKNHRPLLNCWKHLPQLRYANLFLNEKTSKATTSRIFKFIYTFQPSKGDGLPEKVCINCISEMNRTALLKKKCEQSDYTLRAYLNRMRPSRMTLIINKNEIQGNARGSYQQSHGSPAEFNCAKCQLPFTDNEQYLEHMNNLHPPAKPYKCVVCPKSKWFVQCTIHCVVDGVHSFP